MTSAVGMQFPDNMTGKHQWFRVGSKSWSLDLACGLHHWHHLVSRYYCRCTPHETFHCSTLFLRSDTAPELKFLLMFLSSFIFIARSLPIPRSAQCLVLLCPMEFLWPLASWHLLFLSSCSPKNHSKSISFSRQLHEILAPLLINSWGFLCCA